MQNYIAFLRGINVSGQKPIKMVKLRNHLTDLNFDNIQTYIQSGNIIFQSSAEQRKIELLIAKKIKEKYGFDVPVLVKTFDELQSIFTNNPFLNNPDKDIRFLHVTMLSQALASDTLLLLTPYITRSEEVQVKNSEVYLYLPDGYGKTKLTNTLVEKKLGLNATTRNWKTVTKMIEMAGISDAKCLLKH